MPPLPAIDDVYLPLRALSTSAGLSVGTLRNYLADAVRPLPFYRVGVKFLVNPSERLPQ